MALLTWDGAGNRLYETGVDQGVLYVPDANGAYNTGFAWNGLTAVTESPTGAEANAQYADNIKYLNLYSAEQYEGTLEAFTYPAEWNQFDGNYTNAAYPGVVLGQQNRKTFGLSYRTKLGNDISGDDYAYKLHLVYGLKASPSEKAYSTVNESPAPITFSWALNSTPVAVTGRSPLSLLTIDSSKALSANLTALNAILYGSAGNPLLPTPDVVITTMTATTVTPITAITTIPVSTTAGAVTIVAQTGVQYRRRDTGAIVAAGAPSFTITGTAPQYVIIDAEPIAATGSLLYYFGPFAQTVFVMAKTV